MKTFISFIIIVTCFYFSSLAQENNNTQFVATVGNHNISLSQFNERYSNYLVSSGIKDNYSTRKAILNNIINEIILFHYDSNENILNSQKYIKELDEARIRTILAYLKDKEIYEKISVNEEEMREAFVRVNEKVAARHLFAQTEEEANKLYELLKIGVKFETLASQVFTDSVLKNNGGYLGYFTWGDMDPEFEEAAYSLKIGEISLPVKTAQGYSIIKLEDRNPNPLLTEYEFQNKKSHLEKVLKIRKKIPAEKDYINEIFDWNKLTFNEESLKDILFNNTKSESGLQKKFSRECVTYNGKSFSQGEIEKRISDLPSFHKDRIISIETLKAAIEGLLIKDMLYSIAEQKGYDSAEPVLKMIEGYKKNIFLKFKIDEITKDGHLADSVVFSYYKNNIFDFSKEHELNLQEILVDNQFLSDSLYKLISDGSDFGKIAKEFSVRKWSSENNGIMGFAPLSNFGSYKELFWNAQIGEVIGPVKIENLFGIFKVLGKTDSSPIEYNLVKDEVLKAAQFENQNEILQNYLNKIKINVNVEINNELVHIILQDEL